MHAYAIGAADGRVLLLRSATPISLVREGAATTWIHVAMEGSWEGHPAGPFTLTADDFAQVIANNARQKTPPVLDYEHCSEYAERAPAAGWVRDVELRGSDLYALVEFTDAAAAHVRAGEYRYCSAVFVFGAKNRQSGEAIGTLLKSVALTNTPFIDGQEPIRLSTKLMGPLDTAVVLSNNLMGLDTAVTSQEHPMPEQTESPEEKPADKPEEKKLADGGPLAALMAATGMDEMALMAALESKADAVAAALTGGDTLAPLKDATAQVAQLSQKLTAQGATIVTLSAKVKAFEVAEVERKAAQAKAEETARRKAVEAEVDALGIADSAKPAMVAVALSDRAHFDTLVEALKPAVELGRSHATKTTKIEAETITLDPNDERVIEYRRALKATGVTDTKKQDEIIRGRLVALRG